MWLRSPAQINGFLFGVCKTTEIPCNLRSTACNAYQCWDPNQIKRLVFEGFCQFLWIRQRFYFCLKSIPMPFSSPMHWFPVSNPCSWRKPIFCVRFRLEQSCCLLNTQCRRASRLVWHCAVHILTPCHFEAHFKEKFDRSPRASILVSEFSCRIFLSFKSNGFI